MTRILARSVLFAVLGCAALVATPASADWIAGFQDPPRVYVPPEQPDPPVAEHDGTSTVQLTDDCHISGRTSAIPLNEYLENPPDSGPMEYTSRIYRKRTAAAAVMVALAARGADIVNLLSGTAQLRWVEGAMNPDPGETCCHDVYCRCAADLRMRTLRIIGPFPASGDHECGTAGSPNIHLSQFTANGCPPLGIPPIVVRNRLAAWLRYSWSQAGPGAPLEESIQSGYDEDKADGNLPPLPGQPGGGAWVPIPAENWVVNGGIMDVLLWTLLYDGYIFCHNSYLGWSNQIGVTRARSSPESSARVLTNIRMNDITYLHDAEGGRNFFPGSNAEVEFPSPTPW